MPGGMTMTTQNGRLGTVCVDATNTLFEMRGLRNGLGRKDIVHQIFCEETFLEVDESGIDIVSVEALMERTTYWRWQYRYVTDDDEHWRLVNRELVKEFAPSFPEKFRLNAAESIHRRFTEDPSLYMLKADTRRAIDILQTLREKYWLVVASNQKSRKLWDALRDNNLIDLFDDAFSSERCEVRKPSKAFWGIIALQCGVPVVAMIGNSLYHDGEAAKHRIPAFLIDRSGEVAEYVESGKEAAESSESNKIWRRKERGLLHTFRSPEAYARMVVRRLM